MICKKCGKKLPDRAHFCDRCGAKQINNVRNQKTEAMENYDSYRKRKMKYELEKKRKKRRMRIALVWIVFLAIAGAIGGGMYSYSYMMKNRSEELVGTSEPVESPDEMVESDSPEETTETPENTAPEKTPEGEDSEYEVYIDRAYGFKCAYPIGFVTGNLANKNTRLSLVDETGDGEMLISYQKAGKTDTASNLMRSYVSGLGVDPDFNRAGENWYSVTFTRNGRVNHRLGTVDSELMHVYYDFTYEEGTNKREEYEKYIDYIDEYLQKQVSKSNKKNKQ